MGVNRDKPDLWKDDISRSVDMYNDWFINFVPEAYRSTRIKTTKAVEETLKATKNLTGIKMEILRINPSVLPTLRMSTCPPLAVDRLIGLARVSKNLVQAMEKGKLPARMSADQLEADLERISRIVDKMADPDIFVWLGQKQKPSEQEIYRAATIVADRLCGAVANPIIRNAQEKRQLAAIAAWLNTRGYKQLPQAKISRMVPASVLRDEPKWTRFPLAEIRIHDESLTLGDFFTIKRGLATGDNRYFILTAAQIAARRLPLQFFRPILPSPRYLPLTEVGSDEKGTRF